MQCQWKHLDLVVSKGVLIQPCEGLLAASLTNIFYSDHRQVELQEMYQPCPLSHSGSPGKATHILCVRNECSPWDAVQTSAMLF